MDFAAGEQVGAGAEYLNMPSQPTAAPSVFTQAEATAAAPAPAAAAAEKYNALV